MCLLVLCVGVRPELPLIVLANRDEWHARPTAPLHVWADGIAAGRDVEGGGTWLGATAAGRFAALTNVRDLRDMRPKEPGERSRGSLVTGFLAGSEPAEAYVARVRKLPDVRGFNLVTGEIGGEIAWASNRGGEPTILSPGIHGVSNALLDTPWPKVERAKERAAEVLARPGPIAVEALFEILADDAVPPDEMLPDTGVGIALERGLGPIRVAMSGYGTRSSTVVLGGRDRTTLIERTIAPVPEPEVRIELAR